MVWSVQYLSAFGATLLAILYQWYLKDLLFVSLGLGRTVQVLSDFPYKCQRIRHQDLEGCEDMWLDEEGRALYAACSSSASRFEWTPSISRLNASGRRSEGDHISVLHIDSPGSDGLYGLHRLQTVNYRGTNGGTYLDLHGFDVEILPGGRLQFWLINHRPPVDSQGGFLDAVKIGANSTVEIFEMQRHSREMIHLQTIADDAIDTPNNIALDGQGGFLITNDKSAKGGGSVAYCPLNNKPCHLAATAGFNYPNGLVRGSDGLYYIPSSFTDSIRVMALEPNKILREVDVIHLGMPVDNLSVDKNGDIWAAAFPKVLDLLKSFSDPSHIDSPSSIWRIRKVQGSYVKEKVLEDAEASVVGSATVVRHDTRTGKLFIGGMFEQIIEARKGLI